MELSGPNRVCVEVVSQAISVHESRTQRLPQSSLQTGAVHVRRSRLVPWFSAPRASDVDGGRAA